MIKVFDSSRRMSQSIRLAIRPSVFAVFFLTVAGGVARIAAASRGGLFCDEAQAIWIVRMPTWSSVASFLRHHESHPPFYYWLLRQWLGVFGDTERSAVSLSVVLGTILIPVVYRVSMRMFSERVGLIACALSTVAPLLFQYSTKVRPYSLLPLLCTLSIYYLWISLTEMRFRDWIAYVVSTLLLLFTHNWSWLVLAGEWGGRFGLVRFISTLPCGIDAKARLCINYLSSRVIGRISAVVRGVFGAGSQGGLLRNNH